MSPLALVALLLIAGVVGLVALRLLWSRWPTLTIILLLVGVYTNRYKWNVGPVNIRTEQIVILLLAGLIALRWVWYGRPLRAPLPGWYAVGWWATLAFATFLHAPGPGPLARHVIRLGIMVLAFFVTVNLLEQLEDWHTLVRALFVLGIIEAAWGIFARLVYAWDFGTISVAGIVLQSPLNLGIQVTTSLPVPVPYGTIEEGNIFGSTMGALLLFSLAAWMNPTERLPRRWTSIGLALFALAWVLSLARGAWLSVLLVLPLFWVLYPSTPEARLKHLGILILVAPVGMGLLALALFALPATTPVVARLQTLTQLGADPTFNLRMERWVIAWELIKVHPLIGWGPGSFEQLVGIQRFASAWLDSLTIKTVQEAGLMGLAFFYAFWGLSLGEGIYALLTGRGSTYRGPLLGLVLGGLVLFLAYHATDATWLGYMWVWLGTVASHPEGLWTRYDGT